MSTENRTIDLTIDENVTYGLLLQFSDENADVFPPTSTPIDLTGFSLRGDIKASLEPGAPVLASFTTAIVSAAEGIAQISLPVETTQLLAQGAKPSRDIYNPRLRLVGYYDILMTRQAGDSPVSFRIMEGSIFISDGVTA